MKQSHDITEEVGIPEGDCAPVFECEKYSEALVELIQLAGQIDRQSNWSYAVSLKNANRMRDLLKDLRTYEAAIVGQGD